MRYVRIVGARTSYPYKSFPIMLLCRIWGNWLNGFIWKTRIILVGRGPISCTWCFGWYNLFSSSIVKLTTFLFCIRILVEMSARRGHSSIQHHNKGKGTVLRFIHVHKHGTWRYKVFCVDNVLMAMFIVIDGESDSGGIHGGLASACGT